jgi:hypothetical protein
MEQIDHEKVYSDTRIYRRRQYGWLSQGSTMRNAATSSAWLQKSTLLL